jgi:hypothetical protein
MNKDYRRVEVDINNWLTDQSSFPLIDSIANHQGPLDLKGYTGPQNI